MAQGHRPVPLVSGGPPSAGVGRARFPVRRHEAAYLAGLRRREPSQDVRQVLQGIDVATPEADEDRVDHGTAPARVRVPDEEPPFPSHRRRPDRILNEGMPTSGLCRHSEFGARSTYVRIRCSRHNQRPSRKASRRSGGRYRSGTMPDGSAWASARSLSCMSACK